MSAPAQNAGSITIVNVHRHRPHEHPHATHVYCGRWRGSRVPQGWITKFELGNPFVVNAQCSREEAIVQFRTWLRGKCVAPYGAEYHYVIELASWYHQGADLVLGCHCAPQACHCEVIADAIRGYAARM